MTDENKEKINNKSSLRKLLGLKQICVFFIIFVLFLCFSHINKPIEYKVSNYKIKVFPSQIILNRDNYQYSILKNENILITGGFTNGQNIPQNTTEIIDINKNIHKEGPLMNIPHVNHRQFNLKSGDIVIADLNGFETFDYNNNKFYMWEGESLKKILNVNDDDFITGISYVLLPDENILITGGYVEKEKRYLNTAFIADTKNKTIKQISNMPIPKMNHISQVVDENVYILGGYNNLTKENKGKILIFDYKKEKFFITETDFYSYTHMICFLAKDKDLCIDYHRQFCDNPYMPLSYPIPQEEKKYFILNLKEGIVNSFNYPFRGLRVYEGMENIIGFAINNEDLFIVGNDCNKYKFIIYSFTENKFYETKIPFKLYGKLIKISENKAIIHSNNNSIYKLTLEQNI